MVERVISNYKKKIQLYVLVAVGNMADCLDIIGLMSHVFTPRVTNTFLQLPTSSCRMCMCLSLLQDRKGVKLYRTPMYLHPYGSRGANQLCLNVIRVEVFWCKTNVFMVEQNYTLMIYVGTIFQVFLVRTVVLCIFVYIVCISGSWLSDFTLQKICCSKSDLKILYIKLSGKMKILSTRRLRTHSPKPYNQSYCRKKSTFKALGLHSPSVQLWRKMKLTKNLRIFFF